MVILYRFSEIRHALLYEHYSLICERVYIGYYNRLYNNIIIIICNVNNNYFIDVPIKRLADRGHIICFLLHNKLSKKKFL